MDPDELEAWLATRLAQPLPGVDVQHRYAPKPVYEGWRADARPAGSRHASALLLIYPGPLGPTVPLTVRHSDLPHPAQARTELHAARPIPSLLHGEQEPDSTEDA